MAKLNQNQVAEAVATLKEERKSFHPLYGVKDGKGWLTRYPYGNGLYPFHNIEEIKRFARNGVTFDGCGHWGPSPYNSGDELGMGSLGYWLYWQSPDCWHSQHDYNLQKECIRWDASTAQDVLDIMLGMVRIPALEKVGLYFKNSLRTGRMSQEDIDRLLGGHNPKEVQHVDYDFCRRFNPSSKEQALSLLENKKWLSCMKVHARDFHTDGVTVRGSVGDTIANVHLPYSDAFHALYDLGVNLQEVTFLREKRSKLRTLAEKETTYGIRISDGRTLPLWRETDNYSVAAAYYYRLLELDRVIYYRETHNASSGPEKNRIYRKLPLREVAGGYAAKLGSFFLFFPEKSSARHYEGFSLKEAIAMWKKDMELSVNAEALTLDYVRNVKGYCLFGTKEFLKEKMPFLYRQLQPYSSWNDVPEDVMQAEHRPSPAIFQHSGYNPYRRQ